MKNRLKVLYIAGWGRSGSTILDNILGQLDGFFPVGELADIWNEGFVGNHPCGCGSPFQDCPVWKNIIQSAFGGFDGIDPLRMNRIFIAETRTINMPKFFLTNGTSFPPEIRREYLDRLSTLYCAIAAVTGSRVIADSSKTPSYAALLGSIPEIDLYIVHLVRDPKAVAYSWSIRKPKPGDYMRPMSATKSSLIWFAWNLGSELLGRRFPGRYLRIRYEDFTRHPQETVRRILALMHEDVRVLPFPSDHTARLLPTHTMKGNPSRFVTGDVEILPDERWKKGMHPLHKALVDFLTWPLLIKYGYRL
ncbi:MAG: sulfotransferase [Anaerolineales bacterium]|nr:sulfotransferase [Anaerolineales bacterium]